MKRVRFRGQSKIEVEEAPVPKADSDRVLVRVRRSAICGSELHAVCGEGMAGNSGHEAVGVVEDPGGSKLRAGQRMGVHAVWGCGKCAQCAQGRYTWCDAKLGIGSNYHAQFIAAPPHVLFPLPDDIADDPGVLLTGDAMGVCFHMGKRLGTQHGDTVAVVGLGPVGLGHVLLQSFYGARVIGIDLAPERLEFARNLGATDVIDAREGDVLERLRELTSGELAQRAVEATGRPQGVKTALGVVGKGGTVAQSGECWQATVSPSEDLIRRDIAWVGGWYFFFPESHEMIELQRKGLRAERLATHIFPVDRAPEAYADFIAGKTGKALISYE